MKIKFLIQVTLIAIILTSCSPMEKGIDNIDTNSSHISTTSSQDETAAVSSGQDHQQYDELAKHMKVDSVSETIQLETLQGIRRRVEGISMIKPKGCEFVDIKQVPFEELKWYFRAAACDYPYYNDIVKENVDLQAGALYLDYEQTMMIVKKEFEIDSFPFEVADKDNLKVEISPGSESNCKFIQTVIKNNLVIVQADVNDTIMDDDPSHFVKMEYVFKLGKDGSIIPISGRKI